MSGMTTHITDPAVAQVFDAFPSAARKRLLGIRALIHSVAAAAEGVGDIEETLKWGEPAYRTTQSGSGSTIRLGCPKSQPGYCAVYFNCNTDLVDNFRTMFPQGLRFEDNRAIVFAPGDAIDRQALALCIGAALTYHRDKKRRRRQSA